MVKIIDIIKPLWLRINFLEQREWSQVIQVEPSLETNIEATQVTFKTIHVILKVGMRLGLRLSNAQKNFKRQMKELEKEQKKNWRKEKVYNNFTEKYEYHYYNDSGLLLKIERKKSLLITMGTLLLSLMLIVGCLYIIGIMEPTDISSNNDRIIADYIDQIGTYYNDVNNYLVYRYEGFQQAILKDQNKQQYLEDIEVYTYDIERAILEIQSLTPPEGLDKHHGLVLEHLNIIYELFLQTLYSKSTNDTQLLNQTIDYMGSLQIEMEMKNTEIRNELIKVFESVNIEYQINKDGSMEFWYSE